MITTISPAETVAVPPPVPKADRPNPQFDLRAILRRLEEIVDRIDQLEPNLALRTRFGPSSSWVLRADDPALALPEHVLGPLSGPHLAEAGWASNPAYIPPRLHEAYHQLLEAAASQERDLEEHPTESPAPFTQFNAGPVSRALIELGEIETPNQFLAQIITLLRRTWHLRHHDGEETPEGVPPAGFFTELVIFLRRLIDDQTSVLTEAVQNLAAQGRDAIAHATGEADEQAALLLPLFEAATLADPEPRLIPGGRIALPNALSTQAFQACIDLLLDTIEAATDDQPGALATLDTLLLLTRGTRFFAALHAYPDAALNSRVRTALLQTATDPSVPVEVREALRDLVFEFGHAQSNSALERFEYGLLDLQDPLAEDPARRWLAANLIADCVENVGAFLLFPDHVTSVAPFCFSESRSHREAAYALIDRMTASSTRFHEVPHQPTDGIPGLRATRQRRQIMDQRGRVINLVDGRPLQIASADRYTVRDGIGTAFFNTTMRVHQLSSFRFTPGPRGSFPVRKQKLPVRSHFTRLPDFSP